MKTARFAQIVSKAGKPHLHVTWQRPEKDPDLQRAIKSGRLMTLHRTIKGTKKDYATVGLYVGAHAQFLIFPKSLKPFADRRIVGIDYDLIAGEQLSFAPAGAAEPKKGKARKAAAPRTRQPVSPAAEPPAAPEPEPPPPPKLTATGEIEQALAELKARKPTAARKRLEHWLRVFG